MVSKTKEGWVNIIGSTRWHYIRESRSLCGRWLYLGNDAFLEQGNNDSPDNCAACRRKLENEKR